jgi:predicted Zn-dependent protease
MIRGLRQVAAALALLVLAGCGNDFLQRGGGPPALVPSGEIGPLISVDQERALGARAHPYLVQAYGGVYEDRRITSYVEGIVSRLEAAGGRSNFNYQVTVLNSPVINAFALPGGYLYVTRGLVALANTEAELATVLAHEMAHVIARHAVKRAEEARTTLAQGRTLATLSRNGAASEAVLRDARGYLASFSRGQEFEADEIGLKIAAGAGYDPGASVQMLNAMTQVSELRAKRFFADETGRGVDFLSDHPTPPERVTAIHAIAAGLKLQENAAARSRAHYLRAIDGIVYGDDSSEGFVRATRFTHPGLRVTFTVPPEYRLDNGRNAVSALARDGSLIRFDGESIAPGQGLASYLKSVWSDGIDISDMRPLVINGMEALTARASAREWQFRLVVIRWSPTQVFRFLLATKDLTEAKDQAFLAAAQTVRRLSESELAGEGPDRVRVHQVRPGESEASLAASLPFEDNQIARFRVLNGLADAPAAGEWVKVVGK